MIPFLITVITLWIIRVPLSAFLSTRFGTDGIWWGIPAAWAMGSALSTAYYLSGRWRRKVVARPAGPAGAAGTPPAAAAAPADAAAPEA